MLSLNSIINITVNFPSESVSTEDFSLGLIVSKNSVISTGDRVKVYANVDEVIAAGFASNSAEVSASRLYFNQSPSPSRIAIGTQGTIESAVEALTACRIANTSWYAVTFLGLEKADIELIAAYIESTSPASVLFYTTDDADVLAGTAGNVALALKTSKYRRSLGQYSTYADAVASIMGYACGAASVSYDLAFKSEPGVTVESLSGADVSILDGENCNHYALYNNAYSLFMPGVMADGSHFDEVVGVDILTSEIQKAVMSVIASSAKVPLTDAGTAQVTTAITGACDAAFKRGFIASGTWNGSNVLKLLTGASLTSGYSIQADTVGNLSTADKTDRKAPPIYVCIILAGSGESFTIAINVER